MIGNGVAAAPRDEAEGAGVRTFLSTSEVFRADAGRMTRRDGVVSLAVYVVLVALNVLRFQLLMHGAFTTQTAAEASDLAVSVLSILLVVAVVRTRGHHLGSLGLRRTDVRRAATLVVPAWLALTAVGVGFMSWEDGAPHLAVGSITSIVLFAPAAIEEEICFRGYLSTRAHGLVGRAGIAQTLAVALFVANHLPGKMVSWPPEIVTGFDIFTVTWLVNLALIGWVYDRLYRVTGSIWPGAVAHFLVNLTLSCMVGG